MSEKQDLGTVDLVVRSITATQGVNSPNISRIETKTIQNASDSVTLSAKLLTQIAEVTSLADAAQADATAALLELTIIANDDRLSKDEKPWAKAEYDELIAEQAGIDAQLTNYSLTALKTAYDNAVTALTTYLGTLSPAYTDFTTNTTIVGTTFHSKFADVYAARQAGLDGIAGGAKTLIDTAQATADAACTRTFDTKAEIEAATGDYDYEIAYCVETTTFWQCGLSGTAFTDKGAALPSLANIVAVSAGFDGTVIVDGSGNSEHGTITGATIIDGERGKVLSCDGVNDFGIRILTTPTKILTLSVRAQVLACESWAAIISSFKYNSALNGSGFNVIPTSATVARFCVGRTGANYQYRDLSYEWDTSAEHEYTAKYIESTRKIMFFVDGHFIGETDAFDPTANLTASYIVVGKWNGDTLSYFLNANIGKYWAWGREITDQEIRGHALGLLPELPYKLADWKIDPTNALNVVTTYAPRYRGIGRLSSISTAAYAGYTVDSAGTVSAGLTITPNIGDTMVNYYNGGVSTLGIYNWSGSTWALDTSSATLASAAEDLMHLRLGGITIGDYTTWITAIGKTLFIQEITLLASGWLKTHDYAETDGLPTTGFMLDVANQIIKAYAARFVNCTINNAILTDAFVSGDITNEALTTHPASSATFTASGTYYGAAIVEALSLPLVGETGPYIVASGTYHSKTVAFVRYVDNPSKALGAQNFVNVKYSDSSIDTLYFATEYSYTGSITTNQTASAESIYFNGPQYKGSIHGTYADGAIFTALSAALAVGASMCVHGGFKNDSSTHFIASKAERISSTVVRVYSLRVSDFIWGVVDFTQGAIGDYYISLSW
jgi:hypothetical protein